ncbi:MAG: inorganic diphosphatase [Candidatus Cyclobacteriaceae bacterium M2_1C_046]
MKRNFFLLFALAICSCTNYYKYPTFSEYGNALMVVEIPAGTNTKYEYNVLKNKFEVELINDNPRTISFLPYPGNYGFIPSTMMDKDRGGDGDPLDVLVIGSNIKQGSLLEFAPVGVLKLLDNGEEDHKIIGVVVNSEVKVIDCRTLQCMKDEYPGALGIIKDWFANYKKGTNIIIQGWEDEKHAVEMINKWKVPEE